MAALPPNKRQRLSPGPSPLGTSNQDHYPFPPQAQPYATPNGYPQTQNSQHSFNQPQPYHSLAPIDTGSRPAPGTMGPPEKPRADKATDINDLSDLVTAAGVDLRAEENYMAATYRNKHQDASFSTSFGSLSSFTVSPENSFQQWSQQSSHATYSPFPPNAAFSQAPVSQPSVEEELREQHRRAARRKAEIKQVHLRDPFLRADAVRAKLAQAAYQNQVQVNQAGLFARPSEAQSSPTLQPKDVHGAAIVGPDGTGLVAARVTSDLDPDAGSSLVNVLTLLSLACNERVRNLLEDAYAISRSRQHGAHGVVPPEWSGIAQGTGESKNAQARSQSVTHTAWDQIPDSAVSPLAVFPSKHNPSDPTTRLPTPPSEPEPPLRLTIAYSAPLPPALQSLAKADRDAEKRRLERRKKRDKARQTSVGGNDAASPSGVNSPANPAADGTTIPRISKKEQQKQKTAHQTEDYMAKQANQAAAMALGGGSKKYAWMTAAATAAPAALGAGVGLGRGSVAASRASSGAVPTVPQVDAGLKSKDNWKKLGEWREDGKGGEGVQIRDFVGVLERDGFEKKTLARCYGRLSSKDDMR